MRFAGSWPRRSIVIVSLLAGWSVPVHANPEVIEILSQGVWRSLVTGGTNVYRTAGMPAVITITSEPAVSS